MITVILSILLALGTPAGTEGPPAFLVVVHESNSVDSMSIESLSKMFLGKITHWDSGSRIVVVEQRPARTVREQFSAAVHRRPVAAVIAYWQQQIFAGRELPPSERSSDDAVLDFVRVNRNAVGYVSPDTPLVRGVKVVRLTS